MSKQHTTPDDSGIDTTVSQRERFDRLKAEWSDDDLPELSDEQLLKGLMDTVEAVDSGVSGRVGITTREPIFWIVMSVVIMAITMIRAESLVSQTVLGFGLGLGAGIFLIGFSWAVHEALKNPDRPHPEVVR